MDLVSLILMFGRPGNIRTAKALAAMAVLALVFGCGPATTATDLMVSVANASAGSANFAWSSPGLFGLPILPSTGNEPISGCAVYLRSFNAGHQDITVSTSTDQLRLSFDVASDDAQTAYVLIASDGTVKAVDESTFPQHPCSS